MCELANIDPFQTAASAYRMVKPFAVVKFPEEKDSLAAVPVGWLSEDELFCTWPMHVKGCQLISLVEAQAPPGVVGKGWEVFPVIVIKTYCK